MSLSATSHDADTSVGLTGRFRGNPRQRLTGEDPRRGSGSADETISSTHLLELRCGLLLQLHNSNNAEQQELGSPNVLKSPKTGSTLHSKPVRPDTFLIMAERHFTSNICRLGQTQGERECVDTSGRVRAQAGAGKKKRRRDM